MMVRPIPSPQCDFAVTASCWRVSGLRRLALLGLLLQFLPVQGQSPQESLCTIEPRPVLAGLDSTPDNDGFGRHTSLSLNGTIAAIGAPSYGSDSPGYVQVLRFENNSWTQLGSTIFGDNSSQTSTNVVSDDGSIIAVGGLDTTIIRVLRLVDDDWEPLGNNITHPAGKEIGFTLTISGDGTTIAASSPFSREARVFELVGGTWSRKGRTLEGQSGEHDFGQSISLSQDGSRLAVGIPDNFNADTYGLVQVFEFIDDDWVQIGQTLQSANVGNDGDKFGVDVSLSSDGRTLAVGAYGSESVHIYRIGSDGQWFELGSRLIGKSGNERFGRSLALSGDASILIASGSGILRFFEANGNEWIEAGEEVMDSGAENNAAISRDGSTAMGGAFVFDVSCPQETTPNTATVSPVLSPSVSSMGNSIGVFAGALIQGAVFLWCFWEFG